MLPKKQIPGPGQESVWDYPRPPALRRCAKRVRILLDGKTIADTRAALCVLETSHPPGYYLPPEDIAMDLLHPASGNSFCEWKGIATYYDIEHAGGVHRAAAWTYLEPTPRYAELARYVAFYPRLMDACYVGEEKVRPQPGQFYGGWITADLAGPFKGEPGSAGW
ncbi:MAG: DUF427 domain-containing protein [Gammaproteobacteria bacterium]|nr:DUF427 domain-containing protein [Gammaproteobacteria bacterium]